MRVEVGAVQLVEAPALALLLAKELYDAHAGEAFLQKGVYAGETDADVPVSVANGFTEQAGHQHDERDHQKRSEREPPIENQHCDADRHEREQIAKSRNDPRREQLVESLDIRGHPRDETAGRVAVEERHGEPLQVLENLHSDIAHNPLTEETGEPRLRVGEGELEQQQAEE